MSLKLKLNLVLALGVSLFSKAKGTIEKAAPVFENGEAQIVEAFNNPEDWVHHDLWVETEFDSDGDGDLDRMHVSVSRPKQTETEDLKLNPGNGDTLCWGGGNVRLFRTSTFQTSILKCENSNCVIETPFQMVV